MVDVEYGYTANVIIENKSSHEIVVDNSIVKLRHWQEPITTVIASGKNYSFSRGGDHPVEDPSWYIGDKCLITFDAQVEIVHTRRTLEEDVVVEHSICEQEPFELIMHEKFSKTFTYTFTDADYDRAVEWNAAHGE